VEASLLIADWIVAKTTRDDPNYANETLSVTDISIYFSLMASHLASVARIRPEDACYLPSRGPFMSTDKQIAANRANAQKSKGPRSIAGKAESRMNAFKHGMYAVDKTMAGEEAADLEKFAGQLYREHCPSNSTECYLVDTLIHNEWRLRRVRRAEAGLWRAVSRKLLINRKAKTPRSRTFRVADSQFIRLQSVINSCERNHLRALMELQRLQAVQPKAGPDANTPATGAQAEEFTATSAPNGFVWRNLQNTPKPPAAGPEILASPFMQPAVQYK
jgi:hypothetical protein